MAMQTHLDILVRPGQRDGAIAAFRARRVFEECAETVPGFLGAELLTPPGDADRICIIAHWRDTAAAHQWLDSPVRAAQDRDLSHFAAEPPKSRILEPTGYRLGRD